MPLRFKTIAIFFALCCTAFAQQLSLQDCINIALKRNVAIQTSANNADAAANNYRGSFSNILPTVGTSFSARKITIGPSEFLDQVPTGIDSSGNAIFEQRTRVSEKQERNGHSFGVSINQNIFDGGNWWNQIGKSSVDKKAARFSQNSQTNEAIRTVAQNYFDLLKQEKILEVNKLAVQRSEDNLNKTQKMFEIGSVAKVDVFRARVNLGNDKITLISQRNTVFQARQRLNISMGQDPETPIEIRKDLNYNPSLDNLDEMVRIADNNQPELLRRSMLVKSDEHTVKISRSAFLPSVSGFFSYSRDNDQFSRLYNDLDQNWNTVVGISANWNLFNGFRDHSNYQNAKIQLKNTILEKEDYRRQLRSNIATQHQRFKDLQEIVTINRDNLEAAREEYRLAEERYRLGSGTSLDLREGQVNLTDAERILVAAEYDLIITYTQIQELLGNIESAINNL